MSTLNISSAESKNKDPYKAIEEIANKLQSSSNGITILFISSLYDLDKIGAAIKEKFKGNIIGCTTSGELSALGYPDNSISAISLSSERLFCGTHLITDVQNFKIEEAEALSQKITKELCQIQNKRPKSKAFGLLLIDGLSVKEEEVSSLLRATLGQIPFFGGSAGDDLKFQETFVYCNGDFHKNAAIFQYFITDHPFEIFKTQHFNPLEDSKLVITKADINTRTVFEINGLPASEEYARLIKAKEEDLGPTLFSNHPIMIKIGGEYYVRSIQKVNSDKSLTFFCAIDEGLVLTVAKGEDIVEELDNFLLAIKGRINPKLILACECILRRLEILDKNLVDKASEVMKRHGVIGFHTYGEQINGLHVNQTLTGLAIGD